MHSRLLLTRLLVLAALPLLLFTHHLYPEGGIMDTLLSSAAVVLLVGAGAGRTWASLYLAGRKNQTLVTSGPYSLVRHPLYLFSLLGFLGAGLAFESVALALLLAAIFAVGHGPAMAREEARLHRLFGEEYEAYRDRVPALVPSFGSWTTPERITVHMPAFTVALRESSLIPLVLVAAYVVEWAKLSGLLPTLALIY